MRIVAAFVLKYTCDTSSRKSDAPNRLLLHLHILVASHRGCVCWLGALRCRRRPSARSGTWCFLRNHALQVDVDRFAFEDAERASRGHIIFVRARRSDNSDGRVRGRKLFVLLERLAQRVQAVFDQLFEGT